LEQRITAVHDIVARQDAEGWGAKVIDRLAKDLGTEFPGVEASVPEI
jgi:hypothetical protein